MAEIQLHPEVANYIVEIDWPSVGTDRGPSLRDIADRYEAGDMILLNNVPLGVDYGLVNEINVPHDEDSRKLSYKSIIYPRLWESGGRRLFFGTFGLDLVRYWRFRSEVLRLNARIAALTRQIFPGYRFSKEQFSWRFLASGLDVHPLHIDTFGNNDDFQYVRCFVNLDTQPRVWRISHRLDELAERVYRSEGWARYANLPANEFCAIASRYCYEGGNPPYHEVSFTQGDVWLCDTRKISHGVVSGHRLMATHFYADPQSMQDPSKRLNQMVADIHAAFADSPRQARAR